MKKILFLISCLAAGWLGAQAQAPRTISDFEGEEGKLYWNPIGAEVKLEIVDNPLKDNVNGSSKVLKMTLPKEEQFAGAIITVENLLVGDTEGHYRYGQVKFYKPEEGTSILKLQKGPNNVSREVSKTISAGAWVNASFDFNFAGNNDADAVGSYGEVFVIGNTTQYEAEEFVMYIDDIAFSNELPVIDDELPASTDKLAVLDNFENGQVNFTDVLNAMEGASFHVVDNPVKDAVNGSDKVLEVVRPESKPAWIGFYARLNANAIPKCDMDKYRYARFKLLQDMAGASASFKVEIPGGGMSVEKAPMNEPSKVGEWEELIFDMGEAEGLYPQVVIMPDYAENRLAHSVYIDDIMFSSELDIESGTSVELLTVVNTIRTIVDGSKVDILFQASDDTVLSLSVYDTTGRKITTRQVKTVAGENRASLDVDGSGVFFVKVSTGNKGMVSKFYK